jgi:hypothetical protein
MNFFMKLAQAHEIFIINFLHAIKSTQVVFNEMFLDPSLLILYFIHSYISNLLWKVCMKQFLMKWITNFNSNIDFLAFKCQTNHIWAKAHDSNMGEMLCDQELLKLWKVSHFKDLK